MKTAVVFFAALSLGLNIIFTPAHACFKPKPWQLAMDHKELIRAMPTIIYARAKSVKEVKARRVPGLIKPAEYTFEVISVLKGQVSQPLDYIRRCGSCGNMGYDIRRSHRKEVQVG